MSQIQRVRRDWRQVLQQQAASGLNASAYCQQYGIHRSLFYRWRQRLRTSPSETPHDGFIELRPSVEPVSSSGVTLVSGHGWRVELAPDFDAATLERVCTCVATACSR